MSAAPARSTTSPRPSTAAPAPSDEDAEAPFGSRRIAALRDVGAIDAMTADVMERAEALLARERAVGVLRRDHAVAVQRPEHAVAFDDDERQRLPFLLRALTLRPAAEDLEPPANGLPRLDAFDVSSVGGVEPRTPFPIADLDDPALRRLARRVERAHDADGDRDTVCLLDLTAARQNVAAYTPAEIACLDAIEQAIGRAFVDRPGAPAMAARARVPMPGRLEIVVTETDAVKLVLVAETEVREERTASTTRPEGMRGGLLDQATLEAVRRAHLEIRVAPGHRALVTVPTALSGDSNGAVGLRDGSFDMAAAAGTTAIPGAPRRCRIEVFAEDDVSAPDRPFVVAPTDVREVDVPAFRSEERLPLSPYVGCALLGDDDTPLHRNRVDARVEERIDPYAPGGQQRVRVRTAVYVYDAAPAAPLGDDAVAASLEPAPAPLPAGRYAAPIEGETLLVDVFPEPVVRVRRGSETTTLAYRSLPPGDSPSFQASDAAGALRSAVLTWTEPVRLVARWAGPSVVLTDAMRVG
jgi:hypothetical protein